MSPTLNQRCIFALLVALWSACSIALMAWGVIEFPLHEVVFTSQALSERTSWDSLAAEPLVWAGLGILSLTVWGQWLFASRHRRASDVSWPWRLLLIASSVHAAWWVLQALMPLEYCSWFKHLSQATLGVVLFFGVMSERVDARWGKKSIVFSGFGMIAFYALWFVLGIHQNGDMDARILLLFQILPLLLIPAGALSGRYGNDSICRNECFFMCTAYALTIITTWIPDFWRSEFSTFNTSINATGPVLPWSALTALCLLLLIPIGRALQVAVNHQVKNSSKFSQISVAEFSLKALPISSRRNIS